MKNSLETNLKSFVSILIIQFIIMTKTFWKCYYENYFGFLLIYNILVLSLTCPKKGLLCNISAGQSHIKAVNLFPIVNSIIKRKYMTTEQHNQFNLYSQKCGQNQLWQQIINFFEVSNRFTFLVAHCMSAQKPIMKNKLKNLFDYLSQLLKSRVWWVEPQNRLAKFDKYL